MQCDRCGETMRAETVITLRRSFGRVRARQQQAAHCMNCGASRQLGDPAVARDSAGGFWRLRAAPLVAPGILAAAVHAERGVLRRDG